MICTQSIPQLPFIHTQPSTICPENLSQVLVQSSCCKASPYLSGTAAFRSPLAELNNLTSQPNDLCSLQSLLPSPQDNQMDNVHQQPWNINDAPVLPLDDDKGLVCLDRGLGITTHENDHFAPQVLPTDDNSNFHFDQNCHYPPQHAVDTLSASPTYQFSQFPTGCNGAYFCGTLAVNAADHATYPSPSQHNTPFPVYEYSLQQPQPFLSPACCSEMVPNTVFRDENIFKRPMHRPSSTSSGTQHTIMYPCGTPVIQASPVSWSAQPATPDWPDAVYPRSSLQLPQVILDYSTDYQFQQDMHMAQHQPLKTIMTVPPRRKPRLRPSLSESCVPRLSSPARVRAASTSHFLHPQHDYSTSPASVAQLPLPTLLPSMLIHASPTQMPASSLPTTPRPHYKVARSHSDTPQRRSQPSSPPEIDFIQPNAFGRKPVRQEPAFDGDVYTPIWKRRTSNGRWEGWCGLCQSGRWLDLKNSRYWEDKLRNHGICAKTKKRFADPLQIRWVSPDGTFLPAVDVDLEGRNPYLDTRKREGLCGKCHAWIPMDGARTKAVNRPVNWWMHAYKCHNKTDNDTEGPSLSV